MAGARAGAIVRQQQRQCQSLMRMRKGEVSSKNMYMTWLPIRGATKWNTADQSNGACRGVHTSEEEYHAENGAHQLNLLLLNKLSSIFVFVITYHAARQIIERPCHLLSHAVHNSKLTTLPQSKRRWQPSWQRMLEARQIIERLAKDHVTVTLFQNMTWFILGYA